MSWGSGPDVGRIWAHPSISGQLHSEAYGPKLESRAGWGRNRGSGGLLVPPHGLNGDWSLGGGAFFSPTLLLAYPVPTPQPIGR